MNALFSLLEGRPELVGRALEQQPAVRRVHLRRIRYYGVDAPARGGGITPHTCDHHPEDPTLLPPKTKIHTAIPVDLA